MIMPLRIDTIVVSTQHDEFDINDEKMLNKIREDIIEILIPIVKRYIFILKVFKNYLIIILNSM